MQIALCRQGINTAFFGYPKQILHNYYLFIWDFSLDFSIAYNLQAYPNFITKPSEIL